MTDQATPERPADAMSRAVNQRQRSPAELAEQLQRDATSLTLTGASFAKDAPFYETVAANVREAAARLAEIPQLTHDLRTEATHCEQAGRNFGFGQAWDIAMKAAELVGRADGGQAFTWRTACMAIAEAIRATQRSLPSVRGRQVQA